MVLILGAIVAWDAWWLTRNTATFRNSGSCPTTDMHGKVNATRDVSPMGQFGFNGSNDGITMGICIVFNTPIAYVIIWDVLLGCTSFLFSFQNGMLSLRRTSSQTGNVTSGPPRPS